MAKATKPFKDPKNQKVISLIGLMASIFLIFYTPSINLLAIGNVNFTNNLLGAVLFLVFLFYLLNSLDQDGTL